MSMGKINFKFIEIHNFKIYSIYLIAFVQILGKKKVINTKYSNTFYQIEYIINNLCIIL